MSKVIKYASVHINNEKESIPFYVESLKFSVLENVKIDDNEEWWILKKNDSVNTGLVLIKNTSIISYQSTLIIHTDDCVFEYCNLKANGLKEISEPSYSPLGISINFLDPSGNKIMLLEERIYKDIEI